MHIPPIPSFSILIVEDEKVELALIRHWCMPILGKSANYLFAARGTCDEGWELAKKAPFNLYIIDGETPGELQGPEMCRKIQQIYADSQIILYSAMAPAQIEDNRVPKEVKVINKNVRELADDLSMRVDKFLSEHYPKPHFDE